MFWQKLDEGILNQVSLLPVSSTTAISCSEVPTVTLTVYKVMASCDVNFGYQRQVKTTYLVEYPLR
jgi:hypothetical protein